MSAPLVDFHCHLDLYRNHEDVISETERAGIYTLAVTTTPRAWPHNRNLTKGMRFVRSALGYHPQLVGKSTAEELALWDKYFTEAKYIGEVGLDAGPDSFRLLDQQRQVFGHVLKACADAGGKVLSVHAVSTATRQGKGRPPLVHRHASASEKSRRARLLLLD